MNINYWDCFYNDYDYYVIDSETVHIYSCNHPDNPDKYCDLENKWNSDEELCEFL